MRRRCPGRAMCSHSGARPGRSDGSRRTPRSIPRSRHASPRCIEPPRPASSPPGRRRRKARSRWPSCSISSRATCSANAPQAFAADPLARAVASRAIARGFDRQVPKGEHQFFYLPFMHSEALADQERCVALTRATGDDNSIRYAQMHADIIRRFGRFPQRNADARPRHHARGAGFPRRRRLHRVAPDTPSWPGVSTKNHGVTPGAGLRPARNDREPFFSRPPRRGWRDWASILSSI